MAKNELYAYVFQREDQVLVILHLNAQGSKTRIPVATDKVKIEDYGNTLIKQNSSTRHFLVDISPLLESKVLEEENLFKLS